MEADQALGRVDADLARLVDCLAANGQLDDTAIFVTGDAARTAQLRDFCAARGVFGSVFLPPFALDGRSFVRFTVHCGMSDAQCDHFLEVMEAARYIVK